MPMTLDGYVTEDDLRTQHAAYARHQERVKDTFDPTHNQNPVASTLHLTAALRRIQQHDAEMHHRAGNLAGQIASLRHKIDALDGNRDALNSIVDEKVSEGGIGVRGGGGGGVSGAIAQRPPLVDRIHAAISECSLHDARLYALTADLEWEIARLVARVGGFDDNLGVPGV